MRGRRRKITVLAVIFVVIICFLTTVLIFSYNKKNDVILDGYSIEEKGKMKIYISVADKVGYARSYSEKNDGSDKYITFYSTFPLLSRFGKGEYEIEIDPDCENIYFNRGNRDFEENTKYYKGEKYSLVLKKNLETNNWDIIK